MTRPIAGTRTAKPIDRFSVELSSWLSVCGSGGLHRQPADPPDFAERPPNQAG